MSAGTAAVRRHRGDIVTRRPGDALAGYSTMLRFILRRDRIRFPAWTLGLAAMAAYFAAVLTTVFPDPEDLEVFAMLGASPGAALLMGPGFGDLTPSVPLMLGGAYGIYLFVGAGIMSILTVTRHTRAEEQTGRAELVRANVVGRLTPLTSALAVAALMNMVVAVVIGAVLTGMDFDPAGSFALGGSVAGVGLAFAGISATCVQLTEFSRTSSGIAGGVLGASFLVRGLADISTSQGGGVGWISWLSPIGWSQSVQPFGVNDWRPLMASLACFAVFGAFGFVLQSRRDLSAGLVAARRGSAHAARWLANPFALALRLQFASIVGWSASLLAGGLAYGGFTQSIIDGFANAPDVVLQILGGEEDMLGGYLGFMGVFMAVIVAIFAILAVQALGSEEIDGRAEPMLATAVSRSRWLGSWVTISALGAVLLQAAAGLGNVIGTAISMGSNELFGEIMLGHIAQVPAIWVILGIAALLYAVRPRLAAVAWAVFGYSFLIGFFGPAMNAPDWAIDLSPFEHVGRYPADDVSVTAMLVLTAIGTVLVAVSLVLFRRRDLQTK